MLCCRTFSLIYTRNRYGFSRREADGYNRIGLSASQDEGIIERDG